MLLAPLFSAVVENTWNFYSALPLPGKFLVPPAFLYSNWKAKHLNWWSDNNSSERLLFGGHDHSRNED